MPPTGAHPVHDELKQLREFLAAEYPWMRIVVGDPTRPHQAGLSLYLKGWQQGELINFWFEVDCFYLGPADAIIDLSALLKRSPYGIMREFEAKTQYYPGNKSWLIVSQTFKLLACAESGRGINPLLPPARPEGPDITSLKVNIHDIDDNLVESITLTPGGG